MHLIIKKKYPWYSTPSCLLSNMWLLFSLLLTPCCAFKIQTPLSAHLFINQLESLNEICHALSLHLLNFGQHPIIDHNPCYL
jgi:hypothetical protein